MESFRLTAIFLIQDKDCIIIDAGDSADFILEEVSRQNLSVKAIVATHGHFDHVMAVGSYKHHSMFHFYISSKDQFLLIELQKQQNTFLGHVPIVIPIKSTVRRLRCRLQVSGFTFQILATPATLQEAFVFTVKKKALCLPVTPYLKMELEDTISHIQIRNSYLSRLIICLIRYLRRLLFILAMEILQR